PVDDDEPVAESHDLCQPSRCLLRPRDLLLLRPAVIRPEGGIPAECHHRQLSSIRRLLAHRWAELRGSATALRVRAAWSCSAVRRELARARAPGSAVRTSC